jgi:hypothetical protein
MNLNSHVDTLFLTLEWAKQDRIAMLDAVNCQGEAARENVRKEIRAIERLRLKVFGDAKTPLEDQLERAQSVTFKELLEMARNGEIENRADRK